MAITDWDLLAHSRKLSRLKPLEANDGVCERGKPLLPRTEDLA